MAGEGRMVNEFFDIWLPVLPGWGACWVEGDGLGVESMASE